MKSFSEMRTQIDEVLSKSDDMSKWISDFLDSDSPQFKGKSKEKRMQMAKAAYYAAQKEGVMQPNGTDKVGRLKEMKCWDGYKKQGTKIGKSGKVVNNCVKKEDVELDESTAALKKKAEKSGVSLSVLKKVYARGVAAWNSGHRPGTTPQQWGMARVNSYITKGKGTYHGADKDLREQDESHPYHKGLSKSTIAKRKAHWNKKDKLSDKDPEAYEKAPGDANAETKPSKHTKKYKELYGEMKKMNEIGDTAKGQKALKSYSDKAFKSQDKAEAEYDHDQFDSGHHNAKAAHTITKREVGRERAAQRIKKEATNPEAAAKASKKAQMTSKHADEREALAKKHAREKESMKESTAAKIVQTKLSGMDRKNVRIPTPAERRAELEKRKQKQMQKEDIDMLSFDEYLEEDMRIAKATSFAKKHAGDMSTAVKKIEALRKGMVNHPKVKDALKKANEELSDKQKKLDHNKNGKIDGEDLAKLRAKKEVNELSKDTLKSYADKAHQASQDHAYDADHQYNDKKEQEKSRQMAAKRAAGVAKADKKIATKKEGYKSDAQRKAVWASRNEEVEIDVDVEESYSSKSYKDFVAEMDGGRYVHKGTRYGGSAQHSDSDFSKDDESEKDKFKRLLQKKKPEQKPAQTSTVKRGRGRPAGKTGTYTRR